MRTKKIFTSLHFAGVIGFLFSVPVAFGLVTLNNVVSKVLKEAPVVTNMRAVGVYEEPSSLFVKVVGNKERDCGAPVAIKGMYNDKELRSIVFLDDFDPNTDEVSQPDAQPVANEIDFGVWRLRPKPKSDKIIFNVFHDCNGNTVKTEFLLDVGARR